MQTVQVSQCSGTSPGVTQEEPGPKSPHSARNLLVTLAPALGNKTLLDQVDKEKEWLQFDDNADFILDATAKGDAEQDNDHHQFQPSR